VVIIVIVLVIAIVAAIGYFVLKSKGQKAMPENAKKQMEDAQKKAYARPGPPAGGAPAAPR
jgi:flagellar basal body-associated protein FliL